MADADADDADPDLAAGEQRIRSTARWLTVTFGGVAAALLAGLQLTSLGSTSGHARTLALKGYALGIFGVLLVMVAASVVMTAGRVTLRELAHPKWPRWLYKRLDERADLHPDYASVGALARDVEQATSAQAKALRDYNEEKNTTTERTLKDAVARMTTLLPLWDRLLDAARYERLQQCWKWARVAIFAGAGLAAVGIAIFAANVQKPDPATPALAQTPVVGLAALTPSGLVAHRAELGSKCRGRGVGVVVTAADEKSYTLMVVPTATNTCGPAQITLRRTAEGSVRTSDTVAIKP